MILEGAMISIASIALTIPHPGMVFGRFWNLKVARAEIAAAAEGRGKVEKIGSDSP